MSRLFTFLFVVVLSLPVYPEISSIVEMQNNAEQALQRNDIYHSIAMFKEIISINPNYFDSRLGIAEAYFLLKEFDEAMEHITRALFLDQSSMEANILYGRILTGKGEFSKAGDVFADVLKLEKNNVNALLGMAELEVARGNIIKAADLYKFSLQKSPGNRKALISSIIVYDSINKKNISNAYVEQLLNLYPDNAFVNYIAARHYYESGEDEIAKTFAGRSYDLDPEKSDTVYLLSLIYLQLEEYNSALTVLEKYIELDRGNWEIWYLLAEVNLELGKPDKSIFSFATAIGYNPQNELSRIALENILINSKAIDDPVRAKYADYHFDLGEKFIEKNYSNQARNEFRRGLLLAPHSFKGRILYAELMKTRGYLGTYLSMLKDIYAENPNDENLADELEIYNSIVTDTVSDSWHIDQFLIDTSKYRIDIFLSKFSISNNIFNEGDNLGVYFVHNLLAFENIEAKFNSEPVDFLNAFEYARKTGSDFFIIFDYKDTPRSFSIEANIYDSGAGSLLLTLPVFKTGNNKIVLSFQELSRSISESLPLTGNIIDRKFDKVLINLGKIQNTELGDIFYILRKEDFMLKRDSIGLKFQPDKLLGELEITRVDDLVSEGAVKKYNFFDLINPGDSLIKKTEKMTLPENNQITASPLLPIELYKSIISIP